MTGIWQFFDELYSYEPTDSLSKCMQVVPNLVTNHVNECLLAPVSMSEIEKAVFSLGAFKKKRSIVKEDLC